MPGSDYVLSASEAHYGDRYKSDFLTQYRDFVDSAHQVSAKRHQANQFFSSLNTILLAASGLIPGDDGPGFSWQIAIAGGLLCLIWRRMILAYADLNSAKFKVINEMEKHLPAATYNAEWVYFKAADGSTLTSIESLVPRLFIGAYVFVYVVKVAEKYLELVIPAGVIG